MCFPCGSPGKESTCHVGDLGSIPGLGRSPGEGKGYTLHYPGLENSMENSCNVGDLDSIPRLGRSPGEGKGYTLQYSSLENSMDCIVHGSQRIGHRSLALQPDSLPTEPQKKPKNTGVGSLSLLQRIFPTQELNQGLLHCRQILYQLSREECH